MTTPTPNEKPLDDINLELFVDALVYYEDVIQTRIWLIEELQAKKTSTIDLDLMLARLRIQKDRFPSILEPLWAEAVKRKIKKEL